MDSTKPYNGLLHWPYEDISHKAFKGVHVVFFLGPSWLANVGPLL